MTRRILAKMFLAALLLTLSALPARAGLVTFFGGALGQNNLSITLGLSGSTLTIEIDDQNGAFNANENSIKFLGDVKPHPVNPARNAFLGAPVVGGGAITAGFSLSGPSILFSPPQTGTLLDVFYGATGDASFSFALSDGMITALPGGAFSFTLEGILNLLSQNAGVTDDYSLFNNFGGSLGYSSNIAAGATSANGLNLQDFFTQGAMGMDSGDTFTLTAAYTANANITPEPASIALLGIGVVTSAGLFRRRRTKVS
jgi:hypothetical protein